MSVTEAVSDKAQHFRIHYCQINVKQKKDTEPKELLSSQFLIDVALVDAEI